MWASLSVLLLTVVFMVGCGQGPNSPRGFSLPEGDYEQGQANFASMGCNICHSADGVEQINPEAADISFELGGVSRRITTYAELMTSIINPSHRLSYRLPREQSSVDGESLMKNYNEVMTVQQLIDLVAYLQPQYKVIEVTPHRYTTYHP
jgi:cytochrome c2